MRIIPVPAPRQIRHQEAADDLYKGLTCSTRVSDPYRVHYMGAVLPFQNRISQHLLIHDTSLDGTGYLREPPPEVYDQSQPSIIARIPEGVLTSIYPHSNPPERAHTP